ncbi:putative receptor-like protein kinase [Tanacetum coccineum]
MCDSSNYSNISDLDDIEDIELVIQLNQGESSRRSRKAINRDRYIAEARLLADYFAGANNDLTVLNHSPLFDNLLDDIAPVVPFEVNGVTFEKGYYLADGIYPQWAAFVKSFTVSRDERNVVFKRRQKSARKDVERAFGVLQSRCYYCKDEEEVERVGVPQEQKIFTFQALISATNNFENKLGQGGFGPVFKGKLYDGREIAVKKLSETSKQGKREFTNEAKLLACIQHRNVVSLFGFCAIPEKLLVYEYVANESLDKLLFKSEKRHVLDWKRRYSIIVGVAQGLLYLHEDSHDRIIHRDIKASNILLDQKWRPKIADFGMARLYPEDKTHVTTRVAGTNGYMAPEYAMHGNLSVKSDVYSYGVVVLELISGQKNSTFSLDPECQNLLDWAFKLYEKGKAVEIMDPTLATSADPDQVATCTQIGLLCTQSDPKLRPTIRQVVVMLSKQSGTLDEPTKPGFEGTKTRRPQRPSSSSSASGSSSQADSRSSRPFNTTFTSSTSNAHHNTLRSSFVSSVSDPKGKRPIEGLDISIEMIGNCRDKILMLAVVDNGHEMGHVSSVDNIDYLHIYGSVLLTYCAYAFFTDVRILARQPHLDCGCSHGVCASFNFVESERMAESENWSTQQPPQAHTGHGLTQGSLVRPVSWLGNHTKSAIAAMTGIETVPNFEIILNLDTCLCISALAHIGKSVSLKAHDWAHFPHIHSGLMADHQTVVDAVNGTSMRQQLTVETIAEVKAVADMHQRKAETAKHSDNNR